ncbi:hypothetical protein FHX10_004759 [Rhizobium sp. BK591]|uniref:hypothetical protein n=1 Tax=Rhizobium sp. BK591 TaxID=2586985 RepID=UPI0016148E29|nr:hypothetical protein [Rhizobium sp. BK591]MBB3745222.1 hypothetical protein [Rhizobium sp. BK591]
MSNSKYANVETNLFPALGDEFRATGKLDPVDFLAILTWKANRSKTKHLRRLQKDSASFAEAVESIATDVFGAEDDAMRLKTLMSGWDFRLATASAILTVLYPDRFTVYDVRVCDEIKAYHHLKGRRYTSWLWSQFLAFKEAAIAAAPAGLTLREVDHFHWGNSWYRDAMKIIELQRSH